MPEASFDVLLKTAVVTFWATAVLVQLLVFRGLVRRGRDETLLGSAPVRDHLIAELVHGGAVAAGLGCAVTFGWALVAWRNLGWSILLGVELILAFVLISVGAASLAARLSLDLVARSDGDPTPGVRLVRLVILATCGFYGSAVLSSSQGGFGTSLFAAFALGVATLLMGLNRTRDLEPDTLSRLAG